MRYLLYDLASDSKAKSFLCPNQLAKNVFFIFVGIFVFLFCIFYQTNIIFLFFSCFSAAFAIALPPFEEIWAVTPKHNTFAENFQKKEKKLKKMANFIGTFIFSVTLFIAGAQGLCPDKCTCDDVNLIVTCIRAGLEVMPNTLNPRLQTITYKYNNFPMVDVSLR